jgi:RNA polymerase sigma-70 factor (ECF subfamily)
MPCAIVAGASGDRRSVYYHERTIDDVASILGVPLNTVKTRMFYARKRIAAQLAARGIEQACL